MKKAVALGALALACLLPSKIEAKTIAVEGAVVAGATETEAATVGEFLVESNIVIPKGHVPFPSAAEALPESGSIRIAKGYTVTIKDGQKTYVRSVSSKKVADVLKELKITLGKDDSVTPPMDAILKEGEVLRINRTGEQLEQKNKEIPFEIVERENPNLEQGQTRVVQEGINGILEERSLTTYVNGESRGSIVIASRVIKAPRAQIIEKGTKQPENVIQGKKYKKKIVMQATAYDPSAGKWTASGTRARVGAVAVDPRVIPLGTKLYIESADGFPTYGFAVAEDTGGAIKGNKIDLFYNSRKEAYRFGRRNVVVYVLDEASAQIK